LEHRRKGAGGLREGTPLGEGSEGRLAGWDPVAKILRRKGERMPWRDAGNANEFKARFSRTKEKRRIGGGGGTSRRWTGKIRKGEASKSLEKENVKNRIRGEPVSHANSGCSFARDTQLSVDE